MADSVTVVPGQAHIYAMAIDLKDLWKIRAPIGTTQGLNLKHFDQLMEVVWIGMELLAGEWISLVLF